MRSTAMHHAFTSIKVKEGQPLTPLHKRVLRGLERYARREAAREQRVRRAPAVS